MEDEWADDRKEGKTEGRRGWLSHRSARTTCDPLCSSVIFSYKRLVHVS